MLAINSGDDVGLSNFGSLDSRDEVIVPWSKCCDYLVSFRWVILFIFLFQIQIEIKRSGRDETGATSVA